MVISVIIYGVAFAISLALCYTYEKKIDKSLFRNRLIWTLLIIAPTVIISGIRYGIGIDYLEYEKQFYENKFEHLHYYIKEPLNMILMLITYAICPNSVAMFFVYAFITMFVLFKSIDYYRERISVTLSLFIFYMVYYLISYSIIRQMIAVIIILYGTRYIFQKKFWKYLLCVIIAAMIHKTAILMIVLYFFNDENLTFLKRVKLFEKINIQISENSQSIIIYIIIGIFPFILIPLIPKIVSIFGVYSSYLSKETSMSFKFLLYVLPVLVLVLFKRKEIIEENKNNDFFIRMLILQIPFQLMGGIIKYIDRYSLYPAITQIILLSILYKNLKPSKINRLIKVSIILWYIFYFSVMFILLNSNGNFPYNTILINRN